MLADEWTAGQVVACQGRKRKRRKKKKEGGGRQRRWRNPERKGELGGGEMRGTVTMILWIHFIHVISSFFLYSSSKSLDHMFSCMIHVWVMGWLLLSFSYFWVVLRAMKLRFSIPICHEGALLCLPRCEMSSDSTSSSWPLPCSSSTPFHHLFSLYI